MSLVILIFKRVNYSHLKDFLYWRWQVWERESYLKNNWAFCICFYQVFLSCQPFLCLTCSTSVKMEDRDLGSTLRNKTLKFISFKCEILNISFWSDFPSGHQILFYPCIVDSLVVFCCAVLLSFLLTLFCLHCQVPENLGKVQ